MGDLCSSAGTGRRSRDTAGARMRRFRALATAVLTTAVFLGSGCAKKTTAPAAGGGNGSRTWRMGFANIPPRNDQTQAVATIMMWVTRADAAIWHDEPPWAELLAGYRADSIVTARYGTLRDFYRGHGLSIAFEIDPTNGLARGENSDSLRVRGLGLGTPYVQQAFRRWAVAIDTLIAPDWLGLGSEVNLVRLAAPDSVYQNMKSLMRATADTLANLHAHHPGPHAQHLYATVQVDAAWGTLQGGPPVYAGVATELADFSFAEAIGLSEYPYLAHFGEPDSIPLDYFARVQQQAGKPVMVVEGGYTSASLASAGVASDPQKQARYVRRMTRMLDAAHASAWYQLEFADLDLTAYPPLPPGSILPLFATIGFTNSDLVPKPALAPWDSAFARAFTP